MRNTWHDLETYCERPLKSGSFQYAEAAEVMLWSFADGDGQIYVWDLVHDTLNYVDDLAGCWVSAPLHFEGDVPEDMHEILVDQAALIWFHNGGLFDFPVIDAALPEIGALIPMARRRDTMVQAFAHSLPGSLEKLGAVLDMHPDKRKLKEGKRLVRLFCMPQNEAFQKKWGVTRATKATHPADWQKFIEYAAADIVTMREAHRKMPKWNYNDKQIALQHLDWTINNRGFAVDLDLAHGAVAASDAAKALLARQTQHATEGVVQAATQRDAMLAYILSIYGVSLPDMQSDTLERRMDDPDLPPEVKYLIGLRLQSSMNAASKYKTLIKAVSKDGRLRGTAQFRGAGRTGRWAHRLFQPGNLMRPTLSWELIEWAIACIKAQDVETIDMVTGNVMLALGNTVRSAIVAGPRRKLCVADLANIEGRVAAWLAGEDWKLDAFRAYDAGTGPDLYILSYATSFNVDPASVPKKGPERQIGKVTELMLGYAGGVGAWITGAATYGIDLDRMTDQVFPTLPEWAVNEARDFLAWLDEIPTKRRDAALVRLSKEYFVDGRWSREELADHEAGIEADYQARLVKNRHGLPDRTFVTCDAIKRLWRAAHPAISSYWKELEQTVERAILTPGVTFQARKVKVRVDGAWLRLGLPSGRALCYPNPKIEQDGKLTYTGLNQYTRKWGRVDTYGGKFFENLCQAVACDQLAECLPLIEAEGYAVVLTVHDEDVTETPDAPTHTADRLGALMCSDLGWNDGLPLAAAGFETYVYRKE